MRTRQLICRNQIILVTEVKIIERLIILPIHYMSRFMILSFFSLWRCRDFSCQFTSAFSLIAGTPLLSCRLKYYWVSCSFTCYNCYLHSPLICSFTLIILIKVISRILLKDDSHIINCRLMKTCALQWYILTTEFSSDE